MGRKARRRARQNKKKDKREKKSQSARLAREQARKQRAREESAQRAAANSSGRNQKQAPESAKKTAEAKPSSSKNSKKQGKVGAQMGPVAYTSIPGRKKLLEVRGLRTRFRTEAGMANAVCGVDFDVYEGEVLGIVGESGSGKSVLSLSVMRLVPDPPGEIHEGTVKFRDRELLKLSWEEMRKVRGKDIGMIFQEPMTSMNPVMLVGKQITEILEHHEGLSKAEAFERGVKLLAEVGIPDPRKRMMEYPHNFSGGMRQRAVIAMALACNPSLLIADEPTTALDVTIQAQILELMLKVKSERKDAAVILITHDLAVVAETCERVIVMYGGMVQEVAKVKDLFKDPKHPYTKGLLSSLPKPERNREKRKLSTIPGMVPNIHSFPVGCRFSNRCDVVEDRCHTVPPELMPIGNDRWVRCHLLEGEMLV